MRNEPASIKIELLSNAGYKLRGYDTASAMTITGVSGVAVPVRWADARNGNSSATEALQTLPRTGEVMLRAHLTAGAKLYAINLVSCDGDH